MIRVVVLDRHPATCAGVNAILERHAGIVPVGAAADRGSVWPLLYRTDPDVVVLDDPRLCLAVRARHPRARLVLHVDGALGQAVTARLAGADALLDKACRPAELVAAIRGEHGLPPVTARLQRRAAAPLGGTDRAILAMRLAGTPDREIARIAGLDPRALQARVGAIVSGTVGALDGSRELHAG